MFMSVKKRGNKIDLEEKSKFCKKEIPIVLYRYSRAHGKILRGGLL